MPLSAFLPRGNRQPTTGVFKNKAFTFKSMGKPIMHESYLLVKFLEILSAVKMHRNVQ